MHFPINYYRTGTRFLKGMCISMFIKYKIFKQNQRVLIMKGFLRCIECGAIAKRAFKSDPPLCPACRRTFSIDWREVELKPRSH